MCIIKQSSCLSEVDIRMSQVNVLLSEINQIMSRCQFQVQSNTLLPRVDQILSEMKLIVSLSQTSVPEIVDVECSSLDMEWDYDYNYYNLYYNKSLSSVFSVGDVDRDGDHDDVEGDRHDDHEEVEEVHDDDHDDIEGILGDDYEDVEGVPGDDHEDVEGVLDDHDEDDMNIAERVMLRRRSSTMPRDTSNNIMTSISADYPSTSARDDINYSPIVVTTRKQVELSIDNLITFISRIAPNDVFSMRKSQRKKKKKMIKAIHPELRSLFHHSQDLFSPAHVPVPVVHTPLPVVDWTKVNQRSLGNLPTPQMFPKLGCSKDPNIYAERFHDRGAHGNIPIGSLHEKDRFPFGGEFGLMTDLGVISTNKGDHMEDPYCNIVHGHVWSRDLQRWVIYAKYPKDNSKRVRKKKVIEEAAAAPAKKPKRKKELR